MIAELPSYVEDKAYPMALRAAALDSFFVHLRLLTEFLITKPRRNRPPVISRWDYATGFALDNALRDRLTVASDFANTHMAHFNADRVPTTASPITQTPSRSTLVSYADDVFSAMDALVQYLVSKGSVFAGDFQGFLTGAQSLRAAKGP
jgi:hypothetical protein